MGVSIALAIRATIIAAREEIGGTSDQESSYNDCNGPFTVEKIQLNSGVTAEHFVL